MKAIALRLLMDSYELQLSFLLEVLWPHRQLENEEAVGCGAA